MLPIFFIFSNEINNIENVAFANKVENQLAKIPIIYFLENKDEFDNTSIVRWWSSGVDEYTSFFIAFQRKNKFLREVKDLKVYDTKKNLLTVIPKTLNNDKAIKEARTYCENGGKLLLFLSDRNLNNYINFLRNFNIKYNISQSSYKLAGNKIENEDDSKNIIMLNTEYIPVSNSYKKSYFSKDIKNLRVDEFSFGSKGKIFVLINAQFFDNIALGEAAKIPTEKQVKLHAQLFELLEEVGVW